MKSKKILIFVFVFIISVLFVSCSNNTKVDLELISISVTYKDVATDSDFKKYHNVYSAETEIKLERDNYYLIKVICTINNRSSKKLSGLDFVSYSDEYVLYEAGAIDIEPTYQIEPNSNESFEAYIYVDKSLDSEEKISRKLIDTDFKFEAYIYDNIPLDEYSTKINLQGYFQPLDQG